MRLTEANPDAVAAITHHDVLSISLRQPQEPKIDADSRVQHPPMAPLSPQLWKRRCPSGNSSVAG